MINTREGLQILVLSYLLIINLLTFLLFGIDKLKAKRKSWRIPESSLLLLSFLGGSLGGFIGMKIFNHKSRKKKFSLGLVFLVVLQLIALISFLGN